MKQTGIELIAQERKEQIEKHGRSLEYDREFNRGNQIMDAVEQLIKPAKFLYGFNTPAGWSISIFAKMMSKPHVERLTIAGALLAAEIDRLNALDDGI